MSNEGGSDDWFYSGVPAADEAMGGSQEADVYEDPDGLDDLPEARPPAASYHDTSDLRVPLRKAGTEVAAWATRMLEDRLPHPVFNRSWWVWDELHYRYSELTDQRVWQIVGELNDEEVVDKFVSKDGARRPIFTRWQPSMYELDNCIAGMAKVHFDETFYDVRGGCATKSGMMHISGAGTLHLEANGPRHRNRHSFPFEWDELAEAPSWQRLLRDVWRGDPDCEEKIDLLHEFLGVSLFGLATIFEKVVVLHGRGANGKSVLMEIVRHLFQGMTSSVSPHTWKDGRYVEALRDPLLNIVSEMPSAELMGLEVFKALVSGEPIHCDPKYRDPYTFSSRAGHIFSANELPRSSDMSAGFWRRVEVIGFNREFDTSTPKASLVEPCLAEMQGIFRLCVEGAQRAIARGRYTVPSSSRELRDEWKRESAAELTWISERCNTEGWSSPGDLYKDFSGWCEKNGFSKRSSTWFGRRLKAHGIPRKKTKFGAVWQLQIGDRRAEPPEQDEPVEDEPGLFG